MARLRLAPAVVALTLAGCGADEPADPGGLSASEAQELNDAAAMLDANSIALDDTTPTENRQ